MPYNLNHSSNQKSLFFQISDILNKLPFIESQTHSLWSDGENSISEIVNYAENLGIETLAITDHVSRISTNWVDKYLFQIRNVKANLNLLAGVEVRIIDFSGKLDLPDGFQTDSYDLILSSVHRLVDESGSTLEFDSVNPKYVTDIEFELMIGAIENNRNTVIAHPFGMSIKKFGRFPSDSKWKKLCEIANQNNAVLELNSKYHENFDSIFKKFYEFQVVTTLGSDAHNLKHVGDCYFKVKSLVGKFGTN